MMISKEYIKLKDIIMEESWLKEYIISQKKIANEYALQGSPYYVNLAYNIDNEQCYCFIFSGIYITKAKTLADYINEKGNIFGLTIQMVNEVGEDNTTSYIVGILEIKEAKDMKSIDQKLKSILGVIEHFIKRYEDSTFNKSYISTSTSID